ncbi:MAG: Triosephosphate isomerase [Parcubacteria group bacterium GW2011_GWA2_51_10]|nr:MAG: Triosephosphate isomerase [Parcubacteria group bacterium GW2011_GWA2_51_10]
MKTIIVANWKMNPASFREAKKLFEATKKMAERASGVSIIVAPPVLFLRGLAAEYRGRKISFAAQNTHFELRGGFTGEISLPQVKDAGASHVIIGHSERRAMGESNEDTRKKVAAALSSKLIPILCVGETVRVKGGEHFTMIKEQLRVALLELTPAHASRVIIAYEPAWAIGGESSISPQEMQTIAIFISKTMVDMHGKIGHRVKILYGASIGEQNAAAMMKEGRVAGLIVGHVSIDAKRFGALLQSLA